MCVHVPAPRTLRLYVYGFTSLGLAVVGATLQGDSTSSILQQNFTKKNSEHHPCLHPTPPVLAV